MLGLTPAFLEAGGRPSSYDLVVVVGNVVVLLADGTGVDAACGVWLLSARTRPAAPGSTA